MIVKQPTFKFQIVRGVGGWAEGVKLSNFQIFFLPISINNNQPPPPTPPPPPIYEFFIKKIFIADPPLPL